MLDTSAPKIHNVSVEIQQMSGEGMIDYKIIVIASDPVVEKNGNYFTISE